MNRCKQTGLLFCRAGTVDEGGLPASGWKVSQNSTAMFLNHQSSLIHTNQPAIAILETDRLKAELRTIGNKVKSM